MNWYYQSRGRNLVKVQGENLNPFLIQYVQRTVELRSKKGIFLSFFLSLSYFCALLLCTWLECSNFISGSIGSTTQRFFYTWLLTDALSVTEQLAETCQPGVRWV